MPFNFKGQSMLNMLDFSPRELRHILKIAAQLKAAKAVHQPHARLFGKQIAILMNTPSERLRCAAEVAARDLGMRTTCLDSVSGQIGHKESVNDSARVIGRFYDGILYRHADQYLIEALAEHAGVPVWNGGSERFELMQSLADLLTVAEEFGGLRGRRIAYVGDARSAKVNALMAGCAKLGIDLAICGPKSCWPEMERLSECQLIAGMHGTRIRVSESIDDTVRGAEAVYADRRFTEDEAQQERTAAQFERYRITERVMGLADRDAIFMSSDFAISGRSTQMGRALGERFGSRAIEVDLEVFDGERSRVFEQSENLVHAIKAVMLVTLG